MKAVFSAAALALASPALADEKPVAEPVAHRYLIERTFPAGALAGVDAAVKARVNANNKMLGVNWEKSYANEDLTKTYCVYTGPSEQSIYEAAKLNGLPVDKVTEIPADIDAEPKGFVQTIGANHHRYLVTRHAPTAQFMRPAALRKLEASEAKHGARLLTSYASSDPAKSFWVYEAATSADVENAARASGAPIEAITEIPQTLLPY